MELPPDPTAGGARGGRLASTAFAHRMGVPHLRTARALPFLCLPPAMLNALPLRYRTGPLSGRLRLEPIVLACFAGLARRYAGRARTFNLGRGEVVLGEGELLASVQGVAEAVWARALLRRVPRVGVDDPAFGAFYMRAYRAAQALEEIHFEGRPLLVCLGPARPDIEGKHRDLFGQRWTLRGTPLSEVLHLLPLSGPRGAVLDPSISPRFSLPLPPTHTGWASLVALQFTVPPLGGVGLGGDPFDEGLLGAGHAVDVAALYDHLVSDEEGHAERCLFAGARTGRVERTRDHERRALDWQRRQARAAHGPRHLTVGAWMEGEAVARDRSDRPCTTPFLVADVDAPGLEPSFAYTILLLRQLEALSVPLPRVVVSYTGNRGFHVRIPHGMVGRPLWPDAARARAVLSAFFEELCAGVELGGRPLLGYLDANLYSPAHLVRAIGGEHEAQPGYVCVGFAGSELLELHGFLGENALDIVEHRSRADTYSPLSIPDPNRAEPVPALVDAIGRAIRTAEARPAAPAPTTTGGNRGIIARIRQGVAPGEAFGGRYAGRNVAAFLLALYLLTRPGADEGEAWEEVAAWNERNPVPMGSAEGDDPQELRRAFESALRYARREQGRGREGGR